MTFMTLMFVEPDPPRFNPIHDPCWPLQDVAGERQQPRPSLLAAWGPFPICRYSWELPTGLGGKTSTVASCVPKLVILHEFVGWWFTSWIWPPWSRWSSVAGLRAWLQLHCRYELLGFSQRLSWSYRGDDLTATRLVINIPWTSWRPNLGYLRT